MDCLLHPPTPTHHYQILSYIRFLRLYLWLNMQEKFFNNLFVSCAFMLRLIERLRVGVRSLKLEL